MIYFFKYEDSVCNYEFQTHIYTHMYTHIPSTYNVSLRSYEISNYKLIIHINIIGFSVHFIPLYYKHFRLLLPISLLFFGPLYGVLGT